MATLMATEKRDQLERHDNHYPVLNSAATPCPNPIASPIQKYASRSSMVEFLILEVSRLCRDRSASVHDSMLSDVIRGGDVNLVRDVIDVLTSRDLGEELDWVLDRQDEEEFLGTHRGSRLHWRRFSQKGGVTIAFVLLLFMFVIMSPVFYIFHGLFLLIDRSAGGGTRKGRDRFFFEAVRSLSPTMVRLYLTKGAALDTVDAHGNNIYHFIAWLSETDPHEAMTCHRCVVEAIDNITQLYDVIMTRRNEEGVTPMEMLAKSGSLALFKAITDEPDLVGTTIVSVSKERTAMTASTLRHERKDFLKGQTSKLPTELVTGICKAEVDSPLEEDIKYRHGDSSFDVCRFGVELYEHGDVLGKQSFLLQLLCNRSVEAMAEEDVSALKETKFIKMWIEGKWRQYSLPCVVSHFLQLGITFLILWLLIWMDWMSDESVYKKYIGPRLVDDKVIHVFEQMTADILKRYPDYKERFGFDNRSSNEQLKRMDDLICPMNYSKLATGEYITKCDYMIWYEITNSCKTLPPAKQETLLHHARFYTNYSRWLAEEDELISARTADLFTPEDAAILLFWCTGLYIMFDLVFRVVFLCRNFASQINNRWLRGGIVSSLRLVACRRFPGSYFEKQINLATYWMCFLIIYMFTNNYAYTPIMEQAWNYLRDPANALWEPKEYQLALNYFKQGSAEMKAQYARLDALIVTCIIVRLLIVIHACRLVPGFGFFVLITERLAKTLAHFLMVYGFVALAFAVLFYSIMLDKNCLLQSHENFTNIWDSLFYTYVISIGQGNFHYGDNPNTKLTFVVFTIITVLLLLNLIIAMMSTVAEALNRQPWKEMLCRLEMWDEVLGIEAMWGVLMLPLKLCGCRGHLVRWLIGAGKADVQDTFVEVRFNRYPQ